MRLARQLALVVLAACSGCSVGDVTELQPEAGGGGEDAGGDVIADKGDEPDGASASSCSGVSCWAPPANECADDATLRVYSSFGWCAAGVCHYATHEEPCEKAACADGVCTAAPCQGVTCVNPPPPSCVDGDTLLVFSSDGFCQVSGGQPVCSYAPGAISCPHGCASGGCLQQPCTGVVCDNPPAPYCSGNDLTLFEPSGHCDNGACEYNSKSLTCAAGCHDGACAGQDPCASISCHHQSASFCVDDNVLRVFDGPGTCADGVCYYGFKNQVCPGGCSNGQCVGDPCVGVSCDAPPAPHCQDPGTLAHWDGTANCTGGWCTYGTTTSSCSGPCEGGECKTDPCVGVFCLTPPPAHCEGDILLTPTAAGTCVAGTCNYQYSSTSCPHGCALGKCLEPGVGDGGVDGDSPPDASKDVSSDSPPDAPTDVSIDSPPDADAGADAQADANGPALKTVVGMSSGGRKLHSSNFTMRVMAGGTPMAAVESSHFRAFLGLGARVRHAEK